MADPNRSRLAAIVGPPTHECGPAPPIDLRLHRDGMRMMGEAHQGVIGFVILAQRARDHRYCAGCLPWMDWA